MSTGAASAVPRTRPAQHTRPAVDLRLIPAAGAVWLVCLVGIRLPAWVSAVLACAGIVILVAGWLIARHRRPSARPAIPQPRHRATPRDTLARTAALSLAVAVAGATLVAVHVQQREAALAELPAHSSLQVQLRIEEDSRAVSRPAWGGEPRYLLRGVLTQADVRGTWVGVDQPVVLLAPASWAGAPLGATASARVRHSRTDPADAAALLLTTREPPQWQADPPRHLRLAQHLRSTLRTTTTDLPPHAAALIPGIAVGDDRAMDEAMTQQVRITGLTHITAVSGAHVAMVLAPFLLLTGALRPRTRVLICAAVLVGLVVLVRPEPSVVRAALMGMVTISALLLGRPAAAPTSLSLTVMMVLLADPWLAGAYGFVLSVAATGALALLAPRWTRALTRVVPEPLAAAIATTAAAQTVCGPILILLDARVSLVAIPANVLAAPAVPWVTILGLAATLTGPWAPGLAAALAWAATPGTWWIATVARVLAGLPGSTLPWPEGAPGVLLLAALSIGAVLAAPVVARSVTRGAAAGAESSAQRIDSLAQLPPGQRQRQTRTAALALVIAVAAVVGAALVPLPRSGGDWQIAHCDVGQGSALAVRTGPDSAVLIDAGPIPTGARGADTCLRSNGITHLDLLLLTHTHADHAAGLEHVLDAVRVERAIVGPGPARARILQHLTDHEAQIIPAAPGDTLSLGEVTLDIVQGEASGGTDAERTTDAARRRSPEGESDAVNDASLTTVVTLSGGTTVLVAGDLGAGAQDRLARGAVRAQDAEAIALIAQGIDVVVIPHHGSADQSAELAELTDPLLALVSVGENAYGHPAPAALALYEDAIVRRTDECGTTLISEVRAEDGTLRLHAQDACG